MPIEVTIDNEHRVKLTAKPKTGKGKPATVDGDVTFTSSDEAIGIVQPVPGDPLSAFVRPAEPGVSLGDVTVTVSADADLGEGVVTIADAALIHIGSASAGNVGLGSVIEDIPDDEFPPDA